MRYVLPILLLTFSAVADTYLIYSPDDWNLRDDLDGTYVLMADIDLSGALVVPAGTMDEPFTGTFMFNSHTISNWSHDAGSLGQQSLLGRAEGATVIGPGTVSSFNVKGGTDLGALLSMATACTIEDIHFENIHLTQWPGSERAGCIGHLDPGSYVSGVTWDGVTIVGEFGCGALSGVNHGSLVEDCTGAGFRFEVHPFATPQDVMRIGGVFGYIQEEEGHDTVSRRITSTDGHLSGWSFIGGFNGYESHINGASDPNPSNILIEQCHINGGSVRLFGKGYGGYPTAAGFSGYALGTHINNSSIGVNVFSCGWNWDPDDTSCDPSLYGVKVSGYAFSPGWADIIGCYASNVVESDTSWTAGFIAVVAYVNSRAIEVRQCVSRSIADHGFSMFQDYQAGQDHVISQCLAAGPDSCCPVAAFGTGDYPDGVFDCFALIDSGPVFEGPGNAGQEVAVGITEEQMASPAIFATVGWTFGPGGNWHMHPDGFPLPVGFGVPSTCPADVNNDGVVDVEDLVVVIMSGAHSEHIVEVILAWGECP